MTIQRKQYIVRDIPAPKNELGQQPRLYNNLPNQAAQQFVAGMVEWMMAKPESLDRKVAEYATPKVTPKAAPKATAVAVKDQVYFMAEDAHGATVEGNGTIYRIDGQTAQVYYPATKTMLTVDVALMSKI